VSPLCIPPCGGRCCIGVGVCDCLVQSKTNYQAAATKWAALAAEQRPLGEIQRGARTPLLVVSMRGGLGGGRNRNLPPPSASFAYFSSRKEKYAVGDIFARAKRNGGFARLYSCIFPQVGYNRCVVKIKIFL